MRRVVRRIRTAVRSNVLFSLARRLARAFGLRLTWNKARMSCQLTSLKNVLKEKGFLNRIMNSVVSLSRRIRNRARHIVSRDKGKGIVQELAYPARHPPVLHPGDMVRIKSVAEIRKILDAEGGTQGCGFMHEMYRHCGRQFRILKSVDTFFDEARQRTVRTEGIYLLENCICSGRQRLYPVKCDRNCFFFWRAEWLDEVN